MNQQLEASLDALSAQWQNGICPGAQILIRQGGQVLYEKSFGYANLEHQIPITSESIFHVASISKQFTVLSILLLWKDGLLNLDDDIRSYVSDLIYFQEPVTIRQMMNNVSGLRDQWELLFMRGIKDQRFHQHGRREHHPADAAPFKLSSSKRLPLQQYGLSSAGSDRRTDQWYEFSRVRQNPDL